MIKKSLAVLLAALSIQSVAAPDPTTFTTAKKKLYKEVYESRGKTIYCGCDWARKRVDLASCGLQSVFSKKYLKRASRTEAEHIIPASWMLKVNGAYRPCVGEAKEVGESPREYCQHHDIEYKRAHNDLANLFPAVGQINADRSNKAFIDSASIDDATKEQYGKCAAQNADQGFVPPASIKGDIARIAFYMQAKYGTNYPNDQIELFKQWDILDPISDEERAHNKKIIAVQGYGIEQ